MMLKKLKEIFSRPVEVPTTIKGWDTYIRPQRDGYDARIFHALLAKNYGHTPPKRLGDPGPFLNLPLVDWPHGAEKMKQITPDDPGARAVSSVLSYWPEAMVMARDMLDGVILLRSSDGGGGLGCSCGIYGRPPWESSRPSNIVVMTTVDSPIGGAEGIVHELGHHKIHAMRIHLMTHAEDFIANDPAAVYDSPVRFDIKRPMSACFHALFSYVYVTDYYNHVLAPGAFKAKLSREGIIKRQAYNVLRIGNGINLIESKLEPTGPGEAFFKAFIDYAADVYREATRLLIDEGISRSEWESKNPVPYEWSEI